MKKYIFSNVLVAVATGLTMEACSSVAKQELETKIASEPAIETRDELQTQASSVIESTPGLSEEQRTRLRELKNSTSAKMDALNQESLKLRSVLIKDLMSTNYNEREVRLIENRLRKVEKNRLSLMLDSVRKANVIMGRQTAGADGVLKDFVSGAQAERLDSQN